MTVETPDATPVRTSNPLRTSRIVLAMRAGYARGGAPVKRRVASDNGRLCQPRPDKVRSKPGAPNHPVFIDGFRLARKQSRSAKRADLRLRPAGYAAL